jgi:hypothetical protein
MLADAWHRLALLHGGLAMPVVVFIMLGACGVAMLHRFSMSATALAIPLLWCEMFILGAVRRYPFLDARTSYFLIMLSLAVVGVGVSGLFAAVSERSRAGGLVLAVVASIAFVHAVLPSIRVHSVGNEDARSEVLYVARHRSDRDIILVSMPSAYAFAYYWPGITRAYMVDHSSANATGFLVRASNVPGVEYVSGRTRAQVDRAVQDALTRANTRPGSRVWIIRSHVVSTERAAWAAALRPLLSRTTSIRVGPEPLLRIDPLRS